ncbi:MAG: hypothetical protein A2Y91_03280 [Chloroflexi bacterium RBG_13_54_8]|nr:MAG: hypothetical protein A2Y91_03280 [Chloroflexi bacterium RBG_13_54_8]
MDKLAGRLITRAGAWALVVAVGALALNHWNVVPIDKLPGLVDVLYVYVALNTAAACPFIYLERRARVSPQAICPQCGKRLETFLSFKCADCGTIEFKK